MESILLRKVPQEILLVIADTLPSPDLNSLSQTCRVLGGILSPILYRRGAREAVNASDLMPICWASKNGLLNTVKQLLAQGARTVGLENLCGRCNDIHVTTGLHWAARGGHVELVKFYLDIGMDVNAVDDRNASPLHWINKGEGSPEAAQVLLDHGVDMEIRDCDGDTAIVWALHARHVPLVRLLIDSGANLKTLDLRGRTLLDTIFHELFLLDTASNITSTLVKILLDGGFDTSIYHRRHPRYTALYLAAKHNDIYSIELMLDAGLDVNSLGYMNTTALHSAAVYGHEGVASLLLSRGANPELSTMSGERPLDSAIRGGYFGVVKVLLDAGADCFYCTRRGRTPLHNAVDIGVPETVRLLLEKEAVEVNALDEDLVTPLDLARNDEIIELLINAGGRSHDEC
jgi:ankyrin repeat protein